MSSTDFCKQCNAPTVIEASVNLCKECGWSDKKSQRLFDKKSYRLFTVITVLLSIFMVTTYYYTLIWGKFSLQTAPLQIKGIMNTITPSELMELADICHQRKNQQCRIKTLSEIIKEEPNNKEYWAALATAYRQNSKADYAIESYGHYFKLEGKDLMHAYNYAHLLSKSDDFENSKKYYEYVLEAKPGTLQVTVAREYVNLLMKMNQNDEALAFLRQTRNSGDNAKFFMEEEYKKLSGQSN